MGLREDVWTNGAAQPTCLKKDTDEEESFERSAKHREQQTFLHAGVEATRDIEKGTRGLWGSGGKGKILRPEAYRTCETSPRGPAA